MRMSLRFSKSIRLVSIVMILMVMAFIPLPVLAATQAYAEYISGDDAAADVYGGSWFAQTFTPTEAFTLDYARIRIGRTGNPGAITISIRETDDTGKPTGSDLVSVSFDIGFWAGVFYQWYRIDFPNYTLGTEQYALVVSAQAGNESNYIRWRYDESSPTYTGGSYASSTDSGITWTLDAANDFMFSLWGTDAYEILSARVFSGYIEEDDWLVTVLYNNEYPPYYGTVTVSDYFDLQLITGNATVIASTRVPLWGRMPGSLYLSKGLTNTLEWGSSYTVRMRGRFNPYPEVTYVLTSAAWVGSDLNRLDSWVLESATTIGTYYGEPMTGYVGRRKVLNDAGGTLFAVGIPMLARIRPDIFQNPDIFAEYTETEWTRAYEDVFDYEALLGPRIVGDFEVIAPAFGLETLQTLQVAFFGTWLIAAVCVATVSGVAALVVSSPFLIGGWLGGIIPTAIFAVVASIFVFLFIYHFWLSRT